MSDLRVHTKELRFIRQSIISSYKRRRNLDLIAKSTLNSYEDLEFDILAAVKENPHVSKGLLRKLFL